MTGTSSETSRPALETGSDLKHSRLFLRGGAGDNGNGSRRLADDEQVPKHIWWLAGGMSRPPPTGTGLREWKRKDLQRQERERAKRAAKKHGDGAAEANAATGNKFGGLKNLIAAMKEKRRQKKEGRAQGPPKDPTPEHAHGEGDAAPGHGHGGTQMTTISEVSEVTEATSS